MINITICGGGNLGHVVSGVLGSQSDVQLSLLTRKPEAWDKKLKVTDLNGKVYVCTFHKISKFPEVVIPSADIVILCLPGFAINEELKKIKRYLKDSAKVGSVVSSTGFFFEALSNLPANIALFGFQRVPYISRISEYGRSASLLGYKEVLALAVEHAKERERLRDEIEKLFMTPTVLLQSYYEASLTNSNPLLHPARLYSMWKDWDGTALYISNPKFYADWTDEASELYIAMDNEFQKLLGKLPVRENSIPSVLKYYACSDAQSLTQKLRSISAFQSIESPMIELAGGYIPNYNCRYFTEDFPYGMRFIVECALKYKVEIPIIKEVYQWGCSKLE